MFTCMYDEMSSSLTAEGVKTSEDSKISEMKSGLPGGSAVSAWVRVQARVHVFQCNRERKPT